MEANEFKKVINNYIKEICHYSQMQVFATSFYQKNYFQVQIDDKIKELTETVLSYRSEESEDEPGIIKE